jgi:hypothetical protein
MLLLALIRLVASPGVEAGQAPGEGWTLRVNVLDETNSSIEEASVVAISRDGKRLQAEHIGTGLYRLSATEPGRYTIRVEAKDFIPYAEESVEIGTATDRILRVVLRIKAQDMQIFVTSALPASAIPQFLGGVRVLRGAALDSLPSNEEAMRAYLRLLAPRSSGPFGPTIIVDGFAGAGLPPKSAIREIRINDNPFSSEYNDVGTSRVEILTKPGTDNWQSNLFSSFSDESLNSRNAFAPARAAFQHRNYGLTTGGPIVANRLNFRTDLERLERDDNAVINATVLDSTFNIQPWNRTLIKPARDYKINSTINYQISARNTLAATLQLSDQKSWNEGIGRFSLESRAYKFLRNSQTFRLSETLAGDTSINEFRFQFIRQRTRREGDDSQPAIEVPDAFITGASEIGRATEHTDSYVVNNHTTWTRKNHTFKGGVQLRYATPVSTTSNNRSGTYTFTGRTAPQLDETDNPVVAGGQFVLTAITNIESYRRTRVFQQRGLTPDRIRVLGGGPSLFSISSGGAAATIRQYEAAAFIQDDWQARANLSINFGVRFETQNHVGRKLDVAPRFSLAWALAPKTVVRAGSGLFYERFSEEMTMQARLFSGSVQSQFFTADFDVLNQFPAKVSVDQLTNASIPQAVWRTAGDLRAPYKMHSSTSFEQVLPWKSTLGLTFNHTRSLHTLRARNANAPLYSGIRPYANQGEILQFESSGDGSEKQFIVNTTHNLSDRTALWTTYTLSDSRTNTDGPYTFPANAYNMTSEYGRSATSARHTFYAGGWLNTVGKVELTPMIVWRSGLPFNITTGRDTNGDSQFMERPAFAADMTRTSVVQTRFGAFDLEPQPGQPIIPRNFAAGPGFAVVNLRAARYFYLRNAAGSGISGAGRTRLVMIAVQVQNLFNTSNPGIPIGNLSSPLFGRSADAAGDFGFGSNSAGTRRVELSLNFAF